VERIALARLNALGRELGKIWWGGLKKQFMKRKEYVLKG